MRGGRGGRGGGRGGFGGRGGRGGSGGGRGGRGGGRGGRGGGRGGRGGGSRGMGLGVFGDEDDRKTSGDRQVEQEITQQERAANRKKDRKTARQQAKKDRIQKHNDWIESRKEIKAQKEVERQAQQERKRNLEKKAAYDKMQAEKLMAARKADEKKEKKVNEAPKKKKNILWADEIVEASETKRNGGKNSDVGEKRKRNEPKKDTQTPQQVEVPKKPVIPSHKKGDKGQAQRPRINAAAVAALVEEAQTEDIDDGNAGGSKKPAAARYVPPALRKVDQGVITATRRIINKITVENIVPLTEEFCHLFTSGSYSRKDVTDSFCENMRANCLETDKNLTSTAALSYAGLARGAQLRFGNDLAAPIVEKLCQILEEATVNEAEDTAGNCAVMIAQFYLLHVIDSRLVLSLLDFLFDEAPSSITSAGAALALLRVGGERILKENPSELNRLVNVAQQQYRDAVSNLERDGDDEDEEDEEENAQAASTTNRLGVLLSLTRDVASGRTMTTAAGTSTGSAGVDKAATGAVIETLGQLIQSAERSAKARMKAVQSMNVLSVTWEQVIGDDKEGTWWSRAPPALTDEEFDRIDPKRKRMEQQRNKYSDDDESEDSEDEQMGAGEIARSLKKQQMKQERQEEVAASGLRLTTEARRQIFHCIASAIDDVDCFNMLMNRDPNGASMLDTATVLLQACYQEKLYNPFYARVIQRILGSTGNKAKKFKNTFQFAIWDRLKVIRISPVDVAGYINFASLIAYLCNEELYSLSLLRGLDLDDTSKTIGLFTRILMLRLMCDMDYRRMCTFFFGGDVSKSEGASDARVDTARLRKILTQFFARYFVDEEESFKWIPKLFDVVAKGTQLENDMEEGLPMRIRATHKALKDGI